MEVRAPDAAQRDFAERIAAVVELIGDRPLDFGFGSMAQRELSC